MAKQGPPGEKRPGLTIAIGLPRKQGPPPADDASAAPTAAPDATDPDAPAEGGKASAAEAWVTKADEHCKDCSNYHPDTGECDAVEGYYQPEDACKKYFEAVGEGAGDEDAGPMAGMGAGAAQGGAQ